jgi:carboxylate-amine ligase
LRAHVPLLLALSANSPYPEVVDENRFLASRDGMRASFIDPGGNRCRPARELLDDLLAACAPHAAELGCETELAAVSVLADDPGDQRHRRLAGTYAGRPTGPTLPALVRELAADFAVRARRPVTVF